MMAVAFYLPRALSPKSVTQCPPTYTIFIVLQIINLASSVAWQPVAWHPTLARRSRLCDSYRHTTHASMSFAWPNKDQSQSTTTTKAWQRCGRLNDLEMSWMNAAKSNRAIDFN